jgi:hypothetical protein
MAQEKRRKKPSSRIYASGDSPHTVDVNVVDVPESKMVVIADRCAITDNEFILEFAFWYRLAPRDSVVRVEVPITAVAQVYLNTVQYHHLLRTSLTQQKIQPTPLIEQVPDRQPVSMFWANLLAIANTGIEAALDWSFLSPSLLHAASIAKRAVTARDIVPVLSVRSTTPLVLAILNYVEGLLPAIAERLGNPIAQTSGSAP